MNETDRVNMAFDVEIASIPASITVRPYWIDRIEERRAAWHAWRASRMPGRRPITESIKFGGHPLETHPAPWRTSKYDENQCQVVDANGNRVVYSDDVLWWHIDVAAMVVDAVNREAAHRADDEAREAMVERQVERAKFFNQVHPGWSTCAWRDPDTHAWNWSCFRTCRTLHGGRTRRHGGVADTEAEARAAMAAEIAWMDGPEGRD